MSAPSDRHPMDKSQVYLALAQRFVPGASQTFSKAPSQFVQGVSPAFVRRADGCRVWDVDGNEYIDYVMALGALILGHKDPDVTRAVAAQLEDGTIFSLPINRSVSRRGRAENWSSAIRASSACCRSASSESTWAMMS